MSEIKDLIEKFTDIGEYTEDKWAKEMSLLKFCGLHPNWFHSPCFLPCPNCKNTGFYGPKINEESGKIIRKYRACKFCGFWQESWGKIKDQIGSNPYRCVIIFCEYCKLYDWQAPWAYEPKSCTKCYKQMKKTKWASDDPDHPFNQNKQYMDKIHSACPANIR